MCASPSSAVTFALLTGRPLGTDRQTETNSCTKQQQPIADAATIALLLHINGNRCSAIIIIYTPQILKTSGDNVYNGALAICN